jgi:Zn-finger nucleic acid-binding protein
MLHSRNVAGVTVDVCEEGCAGIWFDQGELSKFDEPTEVGGDALLDIPRSLGVSVDLSQRFRCPICPDTVLMRHFFSAKRAVVIDECPTCGGYWLDPGELRTIRSEYPSEKARHQAARRYFKEVLGDRLAEHEAQMEEQRARVRRLRHIFRFLYPSYYVHGEESNSESEGDADDA